MNEKVDIEIARRRLTVEMPDFTPFEIQALAASVSERMEEVAQRNKGVGDSSKLALLTVMGLAGDLTRAKEAHETNVHLWEGKLEQMTQILQAGLEQAAKKND